MARERPGESSLVPTESIKRPTALGMLICELWGGTGVAISVRYRKKPEVPSLGLWYAVPSSFNQLVPVTSTWTSMLTRGQNVGWATVLLG